VKEKVMKKLLLILLLAVTFSANGGILIQVEPYGHDANGYPVYGTPGFSGGDIYDSSGRYLGHLTGAIFRKGVGRFAGGWFVRSPDGHVFKIYCEF
jgi:hypothetical protein